MNRRFGFLAGLDFIGRPADQVANSLAEAGYQAVSWPLAWFDPYSTTSEERRKLVQFTHTPGGFQCWELMYARTSANTKP